MVVLIAIFQKNFRYARDVHFIYNILSHGKGACFAFIGGVYNKHEGSVFGSKSSEQQIQINYKVFAEMSSKIDDPTLRKITENIFYQILEIGKRPFPRNKIELISYWRYYKVLLIPFLTKLKVKITLLSHIGNKHKNQLH